MKTNKTFEIATTDGQKVKLGDHAMNEQQNQTNDTTNGVEKSEILFLYESTYSIPNGDPFTREQRYDEESKKILVSDVRIKRFIRNQLKEQGEKIYLEARGEREDEDESVDESAKKTKVSGAGLRVAELAQEFPDEKNVANLLKKCIDVRLFGGVSTAKKDNPFFKKKVKVKDKNGKEVDVENSKLYQDISANLTGPAQFALLNPSLNRMSLRVHQNTSHFVSDESKGQGAIATGSLVPYALLQIHGWVNSQAATHTSLQHADVTKMLQALWDGVNNSNTRSKSNQDSLLLLQIVYKSKNKKLYGLDRSITLHTKDEKRDEQIRSRDDYALDLTALAERLKDKKDIIKEVRYYTEDKATLDELENIAKKPEYNDLKFSQFKWDEVA